MMERRDRGLSYKKGKEAATRGERIWGSRGYLPQEGGGERGAGGSATRGGRGWGSWEYLSQEREEG